MKNKLIHKVCLYDLKMFKNGKKKDVLANCGVVFVPTLPLDESLKRCPKCFPQTNVYAIAA